MEKRTHYIIETKGSDFHRSHVKPENPPRSQKFFIRPGFVNLISPDIGAETRNPHAVSGCAEAVAPDCWSNFATSPVQPVW
jgi:hypothetical protein